MQIRIQSQSQWPFIQVRPIHVRPYIDNLWRCSRRRMFTLACSAHAQRQPIGRQHPLYRMRLLVTGLRLRRSDGTLPDGSVPQSHKVERFVWISLVCSAAVRLCGRRLMGRPLWSASSSLFSKEMEDWGFASIVLSWMELGSYCLYRTHSLCLEFYFLIRWILLINLNRCLNTKFLNASS